MRAWVLLSKYETVLSYISEYIHIKLARNQVNASTHLFSYFGHRSAFVIQLTHGVGGYVPAE